jgi:hypothetical protein
MTKSEIVNMAYEAGCPNIIVPAEWFRFAKLVAAAEREACAKVVEQAGIDGYGTLAAALLVRERGAP